MVECMNPALPISQQCRLLALPRSSVYRKPAEVSAEDLAIMALIDRHYLARPYYGSRRMAAWLATQGRHWLLAGLLQRRAPASEPGLSHAAANLPARPVDMWTIGVADRLRFPRFPSELGKWGNAHLRPHTHRHYSQQSDSY